MKIAVTAKSQRLDEAEVDPRFGRSSYFVIHDSDDESKEFVQNSAADASHGAGVKAVQALTDRGVDVLITGRVGPKAFEGLKKADIDVYLTEDSTVENSLEAFFNGELSQANAPTNGRHPGGKGSGRRHSGRK